MSDANVDTNIDTTPTFKDPAEVVAFIEDDVVHAMRFYALNPSEFMRDVLNMEPQEWQAEWFQAISDSRAGKLDKSRFAIRSGTGVGKSAGAACLILWHLAVFKDSKIPCTAPTSPQIKAVLWPEIRKWVANIPDKLREIFPFEVTTDMVKLYENFAVARTAQKEKPEAFQGFHCLSDSHTILTKRGWLGVDEITKDDFVLSVPVNGDVAEWMPITDIHSYEFDGDINHYSSRFVDMMFTDEHRFVNRQLHQKDWNIRAYNDIHQKNFFMRRSSNWNGNDIVVPKCFSDAGFNANDFVKFIGIWLSEGGVRPHSNGKATYEVLVYQKKKSGIEWFNENFGHLGFKYYKDFFWISNRDICDWLLLNCGYKMSQKKIPSFIKDAHQDFLELLIDALWIGDGSYYADGRKRSYYSTSRQLIDDIQEILIKLGKTCNIGINRKRGDVANSGIETKHTCYVLSYMYQSTDHFVKKSKVKKTYYKGRVWCVSTPYQTFYTKRSDKVFLSGNSQNIMLFADEASGVPDEIFYAGDGIMSEEGAIVVLIGNPTRSYGFFYDAFHNDEHMYWTRKVSCLDSPRVDKNYGVEKARKHGTDSFEYQVRVLGEFFFEDSSIIIPRTWLDAAVSRETIEPDTDYVVWGADPADGGKDSCALAKRKGNVLLEPVREWKGITADKFVDKIVEEFWATKQKPQEIIVDAIGVGATVHRYLKRNIGEHVRITPIYVGVKATDDRYTSFRVELWGRGRQWAQSPFCSMPKDPELIKQLSSVEWEINEATGKYKIPDKKVDGKSPNLADAFLSTFGSTKSYRSSSLTNDNNTGMIGNKYTKVEGSASWLM